jgi:hypothetical protein
MILFIVKKLLNYLSKEEKHEILTMSVRKFFNTITAEDILKEKEGQWFYEGKALNEATKKLLISQAEVLKEWQLWKILQDDIRYQANKRMFLDSKTENDLIAGKIMLWNLDVISDRLKKMSTQTKNGMLNS